MTPPRRRPPARPAADRRRPARSPRARLRPRPGARAYHQQARHQLRRFRQGSVLAVALTAFLLLLWGAPIAGGADAAPQESAAEPTALDPDQQAGVEAAANAIRDLAYGAWAYLPRLLLALVLLGAAIVVARLTRAVLERTLGAWPRAVAVTALARLVVFLGAAVAILSILAGDARAVVGSVGLLGLAASWALQTPIESFTGWLLNSFRGYYRVGDRIAVGDVFGDVYRIDVLTTTVWEAGGQGKPVAAAQPTGALITVPNWEVLRSNIVNYSRDFPYVWDEITVGIANESDLAYGVEVLQAAARRVLGDQMADAAAAYERLLRAERLAFEVEETPHVYVSAATSWTDCTIRYLVPVRSRRRWSSALTLEVSRELARPEHKGRILAAYPRREMVVREGWSGTSSEP